MKLSASGSNVYFMTYSNCFGEVKCKCSDVFFEIIGIVLMKLSASVAMCISQL